MALTTRDYTHIVDLLGRLGDAQGLHDFVTTLLEALPTLVEIDSIGYEEIRPADGSMLRFSEPTDSARPELWEAFTAHFHEHPMVARFHETGDASVHRLSDFLSDRQLRQTGLYGDVLGPAGVAHQTGFSLAGPAAPFVAVTLARGVGRDFTDRDIEVLEALRRPVKRLREAAESRMVMRAIEASGPAAIVVPGLDGRVVWLSPRAGILARELGLPLRAGRDLPPPCDAVMDTGVPTTIAVDGSLAQIRRLPGDGERALPALLLERLPGPPARRTLDRLGLSPRETDVLHLLVEGRSNHEIAADLVISVRTVRKHLEAVYDKLGVHSRSEAVAVAYQLVTPDW